MGVTHTGFVASGASCQRVWQLALLFCGFLFPVTVLAQTGFYIPRQGAVHFAGDSATIFSNVINQGKLGVGQKAVVNFSGATWENHPNARITDETDSTTGVGGWVRFLNNVAPQRLIGGYNAAAKMGPMFPNLQLSNRFGLQLFGGSTKVRNQFAFDQGLVRLNDNMLVIGHNAPGKITGYSNNLFFVTGTQPGSSLLLRENLRPSDGQVVFPIGTRPGSYTPAAIRSKSAVGDDYFVTAFAGVKAALFTGTDLTSEGVNVVWQAGRSGLPGSGEVELFLQHRIDEEGANFALGRNKSYISQYLDNAWDMGAPQTAPGAGTLTTTAPLSNGGLNSRTFTTTFGKTAYFTKFALPPKPMTNIIWGAYRLTRETVVVNWQTKPEINVKYFVVQRRLSNETVFTSIGSYASKAPNGISLGYLNYTTNDANAYNAVSYYRLQVFDYQGQSYFTNIVAVNNQMGNVVYLWPNPTPDAFSVLANSPLATTLVIYNTLGQKMYAKDISMQNQNVVQVQGHGLIPGAYFVAILDKDGHVLDGAKLIIQR